MADDPMVDRTAVLREHVSMGFRCCNLGTRRAASGIEVVSIDGGSAHVGSVRRGARHLGDGGASSGGEPAFLVLPQLRLLPTSDVQVWRVREAQEPEEAVWLVAR